MTNTEIDWAALARPFDPSEVSFRLQGSPRDGKTSAVVVAYLDSRNVQQRLDEVVGPEGWSFDWQPIVTNNSAVLVAKGTLTIAGVSKSDVGDAGQTEPSKASVSDSLKRAAVLFGIGRYLYDLPTMYAECEKHGNAWYMARGEEDKLRAKYLRGKPDGKTASHRTPQPNLTAQPQHVPASTSDAPVASQTRTAQSATKEQRDNLIKGAAAMGRTLELDDALTFDEAEAMLAAWRREWQQANMRKRPATPPEPDLSTLGNGGGRH